MGPRIQLSELTTLRARDIVIRFGMGAAISVIAAVVVRVWGARVGGLFLAFPAILPASLTLVQSEQGSRRADRSARGAVLGAASLVIFGACDELLRRSGVNAYVSLGVALGGWILVALTLYAGLAFVLPETCDRTSD